MNNEYGIYKPEENATIPENQYNEIYKKGYTDGREDTLKYINQLSNIIFKVVAVAGLIVGLIICGTFACNAQKYIETDSTYQLISWKGYVCDSIIKEMKKIGDEYSSVFIKRIPDGPIRYKIYKPGKMPKNSYLLFDENSFSDLSKERVITKYYFLCQAGKTYKSPRIPNGVYDWAITYDSLLVGYKKEDSIPNVLHPELIDSVVYHVKNNKYSSIENIRILDSIVETIRHKYDTIPVSLLVRISGRPWAFFHDGWEVRKVTEQASFFTPMGPITEPCKLIGCAVNHRSNFHAPKAYSHLIYLDSRKRPIRKEWVVYQTFKR